jgi:site-specific DNA-methyltransferase (adenine-specific)
MIKLILEDSLDYMKALDDNAFDVVFADPPYNIKRSGQKRIQTKSTKHQRKYYEEKEWDYNFDVSPYMEQIFRVSRHQIIFGANYFVEYIKPSMGWIFWDKGQKLTMSDGEFIYTSFHRAARSVVVNRNDIKLDNPFHPTQKPIKLYKWILSNYIDKNWSILDPFLGSGSIAIAAYDLGFKLHGIENDKDYFKKANEWLNQQTLKIPFYEHDKA